MHKCKECGKEALTKNALSKHISTYHNPQEYYDRWIKKDNEDICKICGNKNIFISFGKGYKNGCCREHIVKLNHTKINESIKAKYGVSSTLCLEENRIGGMLKKYRVKNAGELDFVKKKIRTTNLERYGVENPYQYEEFKQKIKNTNLKKYGVEYPTQSPEIREKIKDSFRRSYNCEYALQNPDFFEKYESNCRYARKFKNTNIYYRSSFELDFLLKYYDKLLIENAKSIKYELKGKSKIYYPDFYLPELDLVIEIKSSYLKKQTEDILLAKEKSIIDSGFNFIMILDKDYKEFNIFLENQKI